MPRTINLSAVRAFNRVWLPIVERHNEGARADYAIDYGEFSGPHRSTRFQLDYWRCLDRVAARFNMRGRDLENDVEDYVQDEYARWEKSHRS